MLQLYICVRSVARLCLIPRNPMDCSTTGFLVLHYLLELLKFMFIESVMLSNCLTSCCPLFLWPSMFPSIRVFSNELALCIRWPKYLSFSFSISLSSEYSGLISFRIYRLDLLALQGILKSLVQHHSSKALILQCSAFFMVQIISTYDYWKNRSFDYMDLCQQSDVSVF